jgi:hypothetical protein
MKRLLVVIGVLGAGSAYADPPCNPVWTTVDDFVLAGTTDAAATAVHIDGSTAWVAGMASDALTGHWVVRKQVGTAAFGTADDFIYSVGLRNSPSAIVTGGGAVFVVGGANNLSNAGPWLVRASTNAGASWSSADLFPTSTIAAHATTAVADSSGAILVSGYGAVDPDGYHWYTRRSADFGATWSTNEDAAPILNSTGAKGSDLDKSGAVFVSGYAWDGSQYRWHTRKQTTSGGAWTLIDDWSPVSDAFAAYTPAAYGAEPAGVATGKFPGVVIVAGTAYESDGVAHWIARRTLDGGATWTVVDDMPNCGARGISFDKKDEKGFYVVGRCVSGSTYHWVTRHSDVQGTTWATEDDVSLGAGATYASAIDVGKGGGILAVGLANDGTHSHWIVRSRTCTTPVPAIQVLSLPSKSGFHRLR